jgi:hypothetical protein
MRYLRRLPSRRTLVRLSMVVTLAVGGQAILLPSPAFAATTLTVSTTADIAANAGACGNPATTTPPSPLSLREATCLANNIGGAVTINIPSGTYTLTSGELQIGLSAGQNVTVAGAGQATTIIDAGGNSRVINLDSNLLGGIDATLSGLTITGGDDSTFGGAGIIGGSGNASVRDSLTINSSTITGNHANVAASTSTNNPGGGLQFIGGQLTINNSTISSNTSKNSPGPGVTYAAQGVALGESLTITNTFFNANVAESTAGVNNGGALALSSVSPAVSMAVTGSSFTNNTVSTSGGSTGIGAGIWSQSGALTVTGSTFTGNTISGAGVDSGGAIAVGGGTANLHYNRITGNTAANGGGLFMGGTSTVDASLNWWGCSTGPGTAGCDTVSGSPTLTSRLTLTATASPATIVGPGATSTVTASLLTDSAGGPIAAGQLGAFAGLPVTWSDPQPATASVSPTTTSLTNGTASSTYSSNNASGPGHAVATLDNGTATAAVTVNRPPAITSANNATFKVGVAGTFTVTTTGYPAPAITKTGGLPSGLTLTDNGNGTATIAGTPAADTGGSGAITLIANNGVGTQASQLFTLTVNEPPTIITANTATFTVGTPGTFTVDTSGFPGVATITSTGTLPGGVTFTDYGDGTATVAGTPAAGTGGDYPLTFTAINGITPNAIQSFTLTIRQAPAITLNPVSQTVTPGASVSFTASASGFPAPNVQWQVSTDGGLNFVPIVGATSATYTFSATLADSGHQYRAVFSNAVSSATSTAATLTVGVAPTFSSPNATTFTVGAAGSFGVTTSGIPNATLTTSGTLPAWLTFTDHGDGTGSLTGTPPAGSGATYSFTLHATNGIDPPASQSFVLTVNEPPKITSADHTTFTVGGAGSFTVTTQAGFPIPATLTETGALPSGVSFVDNGNGTAALSGVPNAGSGGSYPLTITAANGVGAGDSQSFTLVVQEAPSITSADHATFTVGTAGSFTVTTAAGIPATTTLTETGALPSGVSFVDNDDGTATIAGTPAAGTGGSHPLSLHAGNGIGTGATQAFTLTIDESPTITSGNATAFTIGTPGTFTVTTAAGFPASTTLSKTGALPSGVTFVDNGDGTATLAGTPTTGGVFPLTITASNGVSPDATQSFTLTVKQPPAITSADHITFTVGTSGTFTVTTTAGTPTTTILTETGALPSGVTFVDHHDGTASLGGTPAAGTGGTYALTLTASNGVPPSDSQAFTLVVHEPPTISSTNAVSFTINTAGSFMVTTDAGYPAATVLSETGALPAGVSFVDHGDGTAALAGTPTVGGVFPLSIKASNGVSPDATQAFTLTVREQPSISSADHTTFTVGTAGWFTVTTTAGTPATTTLTETGALPSGVSFTDNGNGTATLTGTPAAGTGGTYSLTLTAGNGVPPDTVQTFTLTVHQPSGISSADTTSFTVGTPGTFTVTTTPGYPPSTTLTETGALPAGVTFTDNHDGTATLAGTPAAGTGASYPVTITATNAAGPVPQAFTLVVTQPPVITSADATTFTAGTVGTFTVTTTAGFPIATTLAEAGALPSGITFIDNHDGTATLAGTASSGGVFPLTLIAGNGASTDATQAFTLTVNGPPSITSAATMTFTAGVAGTFTVTTHAGVPSVTTLRETGALPPGVTFTDNHDGTATLAGTAKKKYVGTYPVTITASNGIAPDATQSFTLKVVKAKKVELPDTRPHRDGKLGGVPSACTVGQVLHITGTGFAAGAPITVGIYSKPTELGDAVADSSGNFSATVVVPNLLGTHTFLAAGIGANGAPRFLEAGATISKAAVPATPTENPNGGGLSDTGPKADPWATSLAGMLMLVAGLVLVVAGRRRRRSRRPW